MTGWSGGAQTDALRGLSDREILSAALDTLSRLFCMSPNELVGTVAGAIASGYRAADSTPRGIDRAFDVALGKVRPAGPAVDERGNAVGAPEQEGIQYMTAVELANRDEVEPRDEDADPARVSQRVQEHVLRADCT